MSRKALSAFTPAFATATYDNEDRLISWNRTDTNLDQSWSLSEVGNFNTFTENSTGQNRTHGPTHEIQSIDSASLTYDEKGNLTTNTSGNIYIWNLDNLLASTTIPSSSTSGLTGTQKRSALPHAVAWISSIHDGLLRDCFSR